MYFFLFFALSCSYIIAEACFIQTVHITFSKSFQSLFIAPATINKSTVESTVAW